MKDLTTQDGRVSEIKKVETDFLKEMRINLFEIAPNAACNISRNCIELGISPNVESKLKIAFASDISLYAKDGDSIFGRKENEINFGSSGSFTPEVKESYWRTIHAASILKNWKLASEIVNTYCKKYSDLEKEIFEESNLITP